MQQTKIQKDLMWFINKGFGQFKKSLCNFSKFRTNCPPSLVSPSVLRIPPFFRIFYKPHSCERSSLSQNTKVQPNFSFFSVFPFLFWPLRVKKKQTVAIVITIVQSWGQPRSLQITSSGSYQIWFLAVYVIEGG